MRAGKLQGLGFNNYIDLGFLMPVLETYLRNFASYCLNYKWFKNAAVVLGFNSILSSED